MSRIGKQAITIPKGLKISLDGTKLIFNNAKIQKELETHDRVEINLTNETLSFGLKESQGLKAKAFWGTYRALANNIVVGLTSGFTKQLEINGVGYKAAIKGNVLELSLGYSHPIDYKIPDGIEITLEKNILTLKGADKQQIGQVASEIRSFRAPEPYKGKGVKYVDEVIMRKAGKTAKK
ncbi:50S ribosomal protein L6 [Helicobacter sp. MIT 99-5507]|uniref:50S ribosomal protein L6 n=1 Tax=Helicobacter sp. MIT 99-5507 TaxID=152489 RepID=UPI000E1EEB6C|nr:50S ribosomal protein L6 [Helicobacter sp. MIT 99-5507]RDU57279.1 50S ribosomal protein L6 [Helicobacter sp. MIT 99-5507]